MNDHSNVTVGVPPFNRHPVTNKLIDLFASTKIEDILSYDEITEAVGCARDAWRGCMGTARKVLLERYNICLETIPEVGYKHVSDREAVKIASASSQKAHRSLKRGVKVYRNIKDPAKLTSEEIRAGATLELQLVVTSPKATRVLASAPAKVTNGKLDIGTTTEYLKKIL